MDLQLTGRVALITGATRGIGRATVTALLDEGCDIAIVARRADLLNELADSISADGHQRPLVISQDITVMGAGALIRSIVMDFFGRLDILVNNAGGSRPFEGLGSPSEWDEAMLLNFHAGRELAHAFLPDMQSRRFGRIINITGGDEPLALNGAVPPNGATHIWAKALSRQVAKDGITGNCIPPGRLHSEQLDERLLPGEEAQREWARGNIPAGYIGDSADLAVLVAFLASPRARYISGQVIHVDGGARRFSH